jgi:hypothetical protein
VLGADLTMHLTESDTLFARNPARHDAAAAAFSASQALDESCYRRGGLEHISREHLMVQNTFVAKMQAPHEDHKFCGPHDQSSVASRVAAGARRFLTLTQCGERPDRYSEPSRLDPMPSQPSSQA